MREAEIQLIEGANGGCTEVEGVPDMVLEIVSDSSVNKDTRRLLEAYWAAGIKEYWIVDIRGERLDFTLYRRAAKGYVAARKRDGWIKSQVFGKSFQLTRHEDELGNPEFNLQAR